LAAVMDWFSRRVLAWRLSITMETGFCVDALRAAMKRHGRPEIFNTDQGVQFTSATFLDELSGQGVRISMDGKGRFLDNIFIERLWRSLKYEEVYIKAYDSVAGARQGIGAWLGFYNEKRPHQAFGYRTPRAVYDGPACEYVDNPSASPRDTLALSTYSQAHRRKKEVLMYVESKLSWPV
jgi:putative transposase